MGDDEQAGKPLDEMTRDEKVAAGYRPRRCWTCAGAGKTWSAKEKRVVTCPTCGGGKFFWELGPKPREAGE